MIRTLRGTICWGLAILATTLLEMRAMAEPPAGKEIAEVIVQGNRVRTTEQILAKMNTKAGKRYSETTAQEDVGRLLAEGWFPPNGVQLSTLERPDAKISVYVSVTELPNTIQEIVYRGANHINPQDLEKLTGLHKGAPMSPASNNAARQSILRKYQEIGRFWASVYLVEGGRLEDARVVFDIAEGPAAKVSSVQFEFFGPTSGDITTGRLRTQISTSRAYLGTLIGGDYNPLSIDADIIKLTEYYHNLGYLDARIQRQIIWSENFRSAKVVFHLEEGSRYKIGQVQIEGNRSHEEIKLLGYTDLRNGDYYDKFVIQGDTKRIRDFYGYRGQNVVVRESSAQVGDGVVNVHYQLEEREPVRVREVIITGNPVTKDRVIRRQVNLYPGDILSFPDLLEAERNLSRLGIFDEDPATGSKPTVEIEHPEVDEPYKNIFVRVKEKPTGSFMVGAGVTSDAGVTGSIVINERNFDITRLPRNIDDVLEGRAWRGAGQEFRIEAVPGTYFQRYTVSFREPYLFDSRYSLGTSGYFFQRAYNEYTEERIGGRVTFGRSFDNYWSANYTTRLEEVNVTNIPFGAPPDITNNAGHSKLFGQRLNATYDRRDNVLRPTNGEIVDAGAEYVLGDYQYPILTAEGTKFWTTFQRKDGSGKHVVAARSQISWAGQNAPVYERFYAGGFRSLRGFAFRGVGPYVDGFNVGGNFMWLNSLEYQIPVLANDNLYFVAFLDSGTVERSVEIKDYRVTAGVGLRIAVPQLLGPVPLALDFGFPLNQGQYDNKQLFSFWLGFFN